MQIIQQLKKSLDSFKPYYKWIIFNITIKDYGAKAGDMVSFKPYYKWIIFNIRKRKEAIRNQMQF